MAGIDVTTRVTRQSLAVAVNQTANPATEASERPFWASRRSGQVAAAPLRLAPTQGAVPPSPTGPAAVPLRVQATLAADRAIFSILTAGRQSIVEQANLMVSENAQSFVPFTALLGSSMPTPAMPTTPQTNLRRQAAQAADKAKVSAAYADPRQQPQA